MIIIIIVIIINVQSCSVNHKRNHQKPIFEHKLNCLPQILDCIPDPASITLVTNIRYIQQQKWRRLWIQMRRSAQVIFQASNGQKRRFAYSSHEI